MTQETSPGESWIDETLHNDFRFRIRAQRVLHESRTEHQHLIIFDNQTFGRTMMLDGVVQLCERDEFIYHEMMAHVPLFALDSPRSALIVGGGDGGVLREVLKHRAIERATLCEIDRSVIDLCSEHFPQISNGAFDDDRSQIVISDGTKFVAETTDRFDVILVDSTDPIGPGKALFTREFYADCARCLKPGGVLVTQNGLPFVQGPELEQSLGHFKSLFKDAWAYLITTPSYVGGPMALGWASDDAALRQIELGELATRFGRSDIHMRCYSPDVHASAFALPGYVRQLVEGAA
jgi:spermidine synthase